MEMINKIFFFRYGFIYTLRNQNQETRTSNFEVLLFWLSAVWDLYQRFWDPLTLFRVFEQENSWSHRHNVYLALYEVILPSRQFEQVLRYYIMNFADSAILSFSSLVFYCLSCCKNVLLMVIASLLFVLCSFSLFVIFFLFSLVCLFFIFVWFLVCFSLTFLLVCTVGFLNKLWFIYFY